MEFYVKLRELRKNAGYTQEELANMLGVTAGAIGLYEQNRREPDNDTVKKLATIFDVSIDYILGFDNKNESTILAYSGNERIDSIAKEILKTDLTEDDLKLIEFILEKYKK